MVSISKPSAEDKFDDLLRKLCEQFDLRLYVSGWSRKTYDVFVVQDDRGRDKDLVARVESLTMHSGKIEYFDDRALGFCQALGEALETEFDVAEAELIHRPRPLY